jgi:hypothetical protein
MAAPGLRAIHQNADPSSANNVTVTGKADDPRFVIIFEYTNFLPTQAGKAASDPVVSHVQSWPQKL